MRRVVDVWVSGIPKTQGSKDNLGGGRMREVSNRDGSLDVWRDRICVAVARAANGFVHSDEAAVVRCTFLVPARSEPGALWAKGDGDGDKLERAVWDAVTASGAWVDDAQVMFWGGMRFRVQAYEVPGVHIVVEAMDAETVRSFAEGRMPACRAAQERAGWAQPDVPSFWTQQGR